MKIENLEDVERFGAEWGGGGWYCFECHYLRSTCYNLLVRRDNSGEDTTHGAVVHVCVLCDRRLSN